MAKELKDGNRAHPGGNAEVDHGPHGPPEWSEHIANKIDDEQYHHIAKKYGKEVAKKANYGWGDGSDDKHASVATKVYPDGKKLKKAKVIVSEADHPSGDISHRWDDY